MMNFIISEKLLHEEYPSSYKENYLKYRKGTIRKLLVAN
jgi:hypothetical protein